MIALPRIGHEVIVSFLEGNPDRPIITGRVYHEQNRVPYELPAHKTRTVFKSMSTPGKEYVARGFNELRIEDKKGEEEIYLHAEKDVNVYVKNDWKERILHDRHRTVDHFTYVETKGETHETFRDQRKTEQFANENRTVHGDEHLAVDGKLLVKSGDEVHIKAGMKVVIEAGAELTIKAGGQWVKLDPSGIKTSSALKIGQGPPGVGSGASPLLPEESIATDAGIKPTKVASVKFAATMKEAQKAAQPLCSICETGGTA
jgi:type VI secretion system secreted protein VgrG